MKNLLVTFGCSWTWGVGASWVPEYTVDDHMQYAWDESKILPHTFRYKLCQRYGLENENFSLGGSSNQRNFRIARQLFSNADTIKRYQERNATILWGITTTTRNELYDERVNKYVNFMYYAESEESEFFMKRYSHETEVEHLAQEMSIWNDFFNYHGLNIIWFDTFNTHDYKKHIDKLIRPHDLLTAMIPQEELKKSTKKKFYHISNWNVDDTRLLSGIRLGLLNPVSHHPTGYGHDVIVDILSPYVESFLK